MEEDLIIGCKKQDRKAQEALYHKYSGRVMGVCKRYANTMDDANDIFQEAFINIFSSLKKPRTVKIESLEAWVTRISANVAVNYYHKNKKYLNHVPAESALHKIDEEEYGHILGRLRGQELLQLIGGLPTGCKHVFNLYAIEGYSHKEIAEIMDISEGTSKSQLSRARDIIKSKLKLLDHVKYKRVV
ncbi:RNA polymerase sigma factor [Fulvivirga ulvae]|uniref:RNA polymerase sigma factor n=1 Tax=Fulvivirga ulvae TaxID=2904245 RepID=UPI001F2BB509|nr:RNA polymerase sigma factor [Fulvivirga ulvae]UII30344.1 RNA polymerase sigma factor [Fulvivirga ulvae]